MRLFISCWTESLLSGCPYTVTGRRETQAQLVSSVGNQQNYDHRLAQQAFAEFDNSLERVDNLNVRHQLAAAPSTPHLPRTAARLQSKLRDHENQVDNARWYKGEYTRLTLQASSCMVVLLD